MEFLAKLACCVIILALAVTAIDTGADIKLSLHFGFHCMPNAGLGQPCCCHIGSKCLAILPYHRHVYKAISMFACVISLYAPPK